MRIGLIGLDLLADCGIEDQRRDKAPSIYINDATIRDTSTALLKQLENQFGCTAPA